LRSDADPILLHTRRIRATQAIAVAALIAAGLYAFWPLHAGPIPNEASPENERKLAAAALESPARSVSRNDFDLTLWAEPRVAEAPPEPEARPAAAPMKLELLAIISSSGENGESPTYSAAIFDPDAFEVRIVTAGEEVGGFQVRHVTERRVELDRLGRTHELAMEPWGEVEFP